MSAHCPTLTNCHRGERDGPCTEPLTPVQRRYLCRSVRRERANARHHPGEEVVDGSRGRRVAGEGVSVEREVDVLAERKKQGTGKGDAEDAAAHEPKRCLSPRSLPDAKHKLSA